MQNAAQPIVIAEPDATKLDPVLERRQRAGAGLLPDFAVRVQHLEDALRRRNRLLQIGVHPTELLGRPVHQE